ncbi:MAG TPA: cyclase family protein, partial [bacterium]|nr:cyclase family protein [bacterium]
MNDHNWLDITVPIAENMAYWQGDPPVRVERLSRIEEGDSCNMTLLSFTAHTGTHLDAPLHFLRSGCSMDSMPPSLMVGQAHVLSTGDTKHISADQLQRVNIRSGERILFRTSNSNTPWLTEKFRTDYVHLTPSAARYLADKNVALVGIDYLS